MTDKEILYHARRTGRTTRIIDSLVQELFKKGSIIVYDHHTDDHAWNIIKSRLEREHQYAMPFLEFNKVRRSIRFKTNRDGKHNTQV